MKKTVLKGLAMAAVAFAAVLTSCSKEDFNVNVQPSNAKIYFSPSVIDPVANTTVAATFTGAETITGTPNIAAGSVTITATTANGATGSVTVNYDAVEAGSVASYSPVIYLENGLFKLVQTKEVAGTPEEIDGNVTAGHSHNGSNWFMNQSDYSAKFTAEWDETATTELAWWSVWGENTPQLDAFLKNWKGSEVNQKGSAEYTVSAWGMVKPVYTVTPSTVYYDIVLTNNPEYTVGQMAVINPLYEVDVDFVEEGIPGHEGHYEHGHSHGAGTNAGGGIGWAE